MSKGAELILENGVRFKGLAFGYTDEDVVGEIVFSTAVTGYQEAITDPAYCGQLVVFTYPLIGNYGVNSEDMESERPYLNAMIVREKCDFPNNFRTEGTIDEFLKKYHIFGIEDIDTRTLTKIIRDNGCMKAIITTKELSEAEVTERLNTVDMSNAVKTVSTKEIYKIGSGEKHVAVIDLGVKKSTLEALEKRSFKITVFPYDVSADTILSENPDVVLLSSGPGNPKDIKETVETVKKLIGKVPVRGIGLGHNVIGLALGCEIEKLKYGHHGANQPVKDLKTGRVLVTAQNHEYIISKLAESVTEIYRNINDSSCEGICGKCDDVMSVQFSPEAECDVFDKLITGGKE